MFSQLHKTLRIEFEHRVYFTRKVFAPENSLVRNVIAPVPPKEGSVKVLLVLDSHLVSARSALPGEIDAYFRTHAESIRMVCPPLILPGGEAVKQNDEGVRRIYALVAKHSLCRHSCIIAAGGGAILDATGFAAATAHRGIRHVRLPTTTLSQADGGVGVKNGINLFGKKNFIGTFLPPTAIINDFTFLETLPPRQKRAGYVEAVKVALIRDAAFFGKIEEDCESLAAFEPEAMEPLIERCAALHVEHIAEGGDPFETGSARPLDFGHWAAHKLEQISSFRLSHGEAVAMGIAMDVVYAEMMGYLSPADRDRILALLQNLGFALFAPEMKILGDDGKFLLPGGLEEFREHLGGKLTITLLRGIGEGFEIHHMNKAVVEEAIAFLEERDNENASLTSSRTGPGSPRS